MANKKIKFPAALEKYLAKAGVSHEVLEHRTVYTALDAASTMKKKMSEIAKALLVKADRDYYVVVLPADQNVDLPKLAKCLGAQAQSPIKAVTIPGEKIVANVLKFKQGAVSAFGGIYRLPVVMEGSLAKVKQAVFGTGNFNHSVAMAVKDFAKLEQAVVGKFGKLKKIKIQKMTKAKRGKPKKGTKKKPVTGKKLLTKKPADRKIGKTGKKGKK